MAALIAFYSRAGENYFGGAYRRISVGNAEKAAELLADITGGELFHIRQAEPYSDDYQTCIAQAQQDLPEPRPAPGTGPAGRPGCLCGDLPGLSQLLGHHAYGGLHISGALRLYRQSHPSLLHP